MAKQNKADTTDKIKSVIGTEMTRCIGRQGGELSNARADLKARYLGLGYAVDEKQRKDGWSTYVDRSVMEAVEWAKPGLMRVFAGNDEIVRFEAESPGGEQAAKDATDFVNQIVFQQNAYRLVHDCLTDGLMQRVGWAKVWYEDRDEDVAHEYEGLNEEEAIALLMQYPQATDVDLEHESEEGEEDAGNPASYCLKFKCKKDVKGIRVDPIPSENVIISQDARSIEDARFVAHWEMRMAGDLLAEGYSQDQIDEIPRDSQDSLGDYEEGRIQRRVNSEEPGNPDAADESTQLVKIYEAWLFCDIDGDGEPERIKVVYGGEDSSPVVLDWEEWTMPRPPIFAACSVPLPHSVVGLGIADFVMDVQRLRSELTRYMLDNLYLSNQGELIANQGQNGRVDMDQLLSRRAGGVYTIEGDASILPLQVISTANEALAALQLTEKTKEARTGIGQNTMGVQADALQGTATGAAIQEESINQRLELVARNYAENFFKPLATYTLHLMSRYHDREAEIMLKGRPLATRPADWSPDMSVSVSVGLGTGNRSRQAQGIQMIMAIQQQSMQALGPASPVKLSHVMYSAKRLASCLGFQDSDAFFGTDEDIKRAEQMMQNPPPPAEDPNKALVEIEQAKANAQMQTAQANVQIKQMELEAKQREGAAGVMIESRNEERKHELEMQRMQAQLVLEQAKLALLERKTALEMAVQETKVNNQAALDGRRIELEHELKTLSAQEQARSAQQFPQMPQGGM